MGLLDRFAKKGARESAADEAPTTGDEPATLAGGRGSSGPEDRPNLLGRLRQGLRRTSQLLNTDLRDLFKQDGQLVDDAMLDQLYALLVRTDMGSGPAREIRQQIHDEFRGRVVNMSDILHSVQQRLRQLMAQDHCPLNLQSDGPTVIVVVGVNGSGKTTSIAKLAKLLIDQGHRVVLGAGDTFRAAAVEQLSVWAQRLGAEIVTGPPGSDPASVAHRAVARLMESNADVAIIDTAGRLQTQSHLMDQLTKIRRVIERQVGTPPHEVLLVLDATAGQNGISQAKGFSEAVQCTGIILSKLDGTAKGGVIIPIRQQFAMPVKYVGIGEQPTDLAPFDPETFVTALFSNS